jgi:uncharacterized tellurite resistance protein B-like protein
MKFVDILNVFRNGSGTAKSHMKNLIEMAAVDGHFAPSEFELLTSIAKRNGISESHLKEIRDHHNSIQFELPKDNKEKFHQFYDLVNMMTVDKNVHAEEQKLCSLFAVKFGYPRPQINELISVIQANIKNGQGPDETMKRVQMMLGH